MGIVLDPSTACRPQAIGEFLAPYSTMSGSVRATAKALLAVSGRQLSHRG